MFNDDFFHILKKISPSPAFEKSIKFEFAQMSISLTFLADTAVWMMKKKLKYNFLEMNNFFSRLYLLCVYERKKVNPLLLYFFSWSFIANPWPSSLKKLKDPNLDHQIGLSPGSPGRQVLWPRPLWMCSGKFSSGCLEDLGRSLASGFPGLRGTQCCPDWSGEPGQMSKYVI